MLNNQILLDITQTVNKVRIKTRLNFDLNLFSPVFTIRHGSGTLFTNIPKIFFLIYSVAKFNSYSRPLIVPHLVDLEDVEL